MKSKKVIKGLSFILSLILICSISVPYVTAVGDPTITVASVEADPGETVDVTVSLANNPGVLSATLNVEFNSDVLTLTNVTDAGVLGTKYHKPEKVSPYTLSWVNDDKDTNFTANGTVATLTFAVSNNAVEGQTYPITVSYDIDNYDVYNADYETIDFTIANGGVTIKQAAASTDPTITVASVEADPGETVDVTVSLANNPGVLSATLNVEFNSDVLTLTNVTDAGVLGTKYHKPEKVSPYTLSWVNDDKDTNFTANGTVATLTFAVSNNAVAGQTYPITVSYDIDNYDVYNADYETIDFTIANGGVTIKQAASEENVEKLDVATYKSGETPVAPTKAGKVFAGWFEDEECTTPYMGTTGEAYAKFVDEDVHKVMFQCDVNTTPTSDCDYLRLVTTTDSLKYKKVGFIIKHEGSTYKSNGTNVVYTQVRGQSETYTPKAFSESSNWFATFVITDIPNAAFDKEFQFSAYWVTCDGTEVVGTVKTSTINQYLSAV